MKTIKRLWFLAPIMIALVSLIVVVASTASAAGVGENAISNVLNGTADVTLDTNSVSLSWSTTSESAGFSTSDPDFKLHPGDTADLWIKAVNNEVDDIDMMYWVSGLTETMSDGSIIIKYEDPSTPGSFIDLEWDGTNSVHYFPAGGFTLSSTDDVIQLEVTATSHTGSVNLAIWAVEVTP